MDDLREKVIRGMECCMRPNDTNLCGECPYSETSDTLFGCMQTTMYDALSLLKAQEPVEPIEIINDFYPIGDPLRTEGWRCGKCKQRIAWDDNYCSKCGTAVKWVE